MKIKFDTDTITINDIKVVIKTLEKTIQEREVKYQLGNVFGVILEQNGDQKDVVLVQLEEHDFTFIVIDTCKPLESSITIQNYLKGNLTRNDINALTGGLNWKFICNSLEDYFGIA